MRLSDWLNVYSSPINRHSLGLDVQADADDLDGRACAQLLAAVLSGPGIEGVRALALGRCLGASLCLPPIASDLLIRATSDAGNISQCKMMFKDGKEDAHRSILCHACLSLAPSLFICKVRERRGVPDGVAG